MAYVEAATAREAQDAPDTLDARAAGPHRPAGDHGGSRWIRPHHGLVARPLAVRSRWRHLLPARRRVGAQTLSLPTRYVWRMAYPQPAQEGQQSLRLVRQAPRPG